MRTLVANPWALLALLAVGCGTDDAPELGSPPTTSPSTTPVGTTGAPGYRVLDPVDRAIRVSVSVRGVRPSVEELDAVRADPAVLPDLVDAWLDDPAFGLMARDMWAEILQLRNDTFNQLPALGPLKGRTLQDLYLGTVDEPLALVEHIYANDLPMTELVTSELAFANDVTATMYGLDYDESLGGWQATRWSDARPPAGLLSSAQVFRRWESDGSNFNRGRANMLADVFLCEAFSERDIVVEGGIDIADEHEVAYAVRTNASCVSCHQALDPIAAYFWGYKKLIHRNYVADSITYGCEFDWSDGNTPEFGTSYLPEDFCYPLRQYSPEDEDDWLDWDLRTPGFYGIEARDLTDVGHLVADDPRFASCMVRQTAGYLAQVERHDIPWPMVDELTDRFVADGYSPKALVKAIVLSDAFAAYGPTDAGSSQADDPMARMRVARPEQYARQLEALTGFRWNARPDLLNCNDPGNEDVQRFGTQCWGEVDLSDSDVFGYRAMAGGIDGKVVTRPTRTFTPTRSLVYAQLAANAAGFVVERELALPASQRSLLGLAEDPRSQLVALHDVLYGEVVEPMGPEVEADLLLLGSGDATGWKLVLTAMLQDPRLLMF